MEKFVRMVVAPVVFPRWLAMGVVLFWVNSMFFEGFLWVSAIVSLLGWALIVCGLVAWAWRYVKKRPFQVAVLHYLTEYPVSKQRGIFRDTTPVRYHNLNVETDPVITFDMTRGDVPKEGEK